MKPGYALALVLGGSAALFGLVFDPPARLIWNRTASAPEGLYWLRDEPFTKGRWVVLSARSGPAQWAQARGFVGHDWPLLKQVSGLEGDVICREGTAILINGEPAATALLHDRNGALLPAWDGCRVLEAGEVFLLSPHPSSLDGRYFGPVDEADILGVAAPFFVSSVHDHSADVCNSVQAGAGISKADPLGQVKRAGARPCLAPCLHNEFSVPFAPGRDTGFSTIASSCSRSGWRHTPRGEPADDG